MMTLKIMMFQFMRLLQRKIFVSTQRLKNAEFDYKWSFRSRAIFYVDSGNNKILFTPTIPVIIIF
jgi:hypothetical protein